MGSQSCWSSTTPIPQILWVRYILFTLFVAVLLRRRACAPHIEAASRWLQTLRALLIVVENGLFVLAFVLPSARRRPRDCGRVTAGGRGAFRTLLGEKVGPRRWLAVAAGFVGVLLIVRPGFVTLEWP